MLDIALEEFVASLASKGLRRGWIVSAPDGGPLRVSAPEFEPLAGWLAAECPDFRAHEAIFFEVARGSGALFGTFIHRTIRGQAQGGVRHWPYESLADYVCDGLRLAEGMGRKCALAGLWWGGGKAIIARPKGAPASSGEERSKLYREFARFVSSLRGCYITAEDAGTTPSDMADVFRATRFATCVPPEFGGSGNPSEMTAAGVVRAMEAALDWAGLGALAQRRIAMQGAGNVGTFMIEKLLERGVARIIASECCAERRSMLLDHFGERALDVRLVEPGDDSILAEPCDVLAANALGGVLNAKTIPSIQASVVCGAANNPLADEVRDAQSLADRGILYVPDYLANRMGIVACSNEHAGSLREDPEIQRHLACGLPGSIDAVTREVLDIARSSGTTTVAAANRLADAASEVPHPIWGHRARAIIESLVKSRWEMQQD